jgi:predicted ABC-class ATPase
VPFQSPESLRRNYRLPSGREVTGMGLARGVTVIAGGGFHGKSTLLRALQSGVYDHVEGDGREFVIAVDDAVALRAEDGRAVTGVDISQFIDGLPTGADTTSFSTPNASGSTSQAAWLSEALEAGSSCLLIDEDTSATNFMIRDERMRLLVPADREPITPLIDRIRGLWKGTGVSTVLVTGGSGAYLDVADQVLLMDNYRAVDVTERAAELREPVPAQEPYPLPSPRLPRIDVRGKRPPQATGLHAIRVGDGQLDLSALAQLVDDSQTRTIATLLPRIQQRLEGGMSLAEAVAAVLREGVVAQPGRHPGKLAQVRPQELTFAVNHLRP